jgi:hypothetical protein
VAAVIGSLSCSRYYCNWERRDKDINVCYLWLFLTSFNVVMGYLRIVPVIKMNIQLVADISFEKTLKPRRKVAYCTGTVIEPTYDIQAVHRINIRRHEL